MWVAALHGRLAGYQWTNAGHRVGRWHVELDPDDLVIYSVVTMPELRGHGLAAAMTCHIIDTLEPDRAFIDCMEWNTSSRRFIRRAGFEQVTTVTDRPAGVARRLPTPPVNCTLAAIETAEAWERAVATFADHSYRQSWAWGAVSSARVKARCERRALIRHDRELISVASVWVRQAPGLPGIAYVSGGPLVRRCGDDEVVQRERLVLALRALVSEYVLARRMILRVVPSPTDTAWREVEEEVFAAAGFVPTTRVTRPATILVDLGMSAPQLRASFRQKWRNQLNRAEREPLTVRAGRDPGLLDEFVPLFDELVARKGFDPGLPAAVFADVQRQSSESSRFHIALAAIDGQTVAGQVTAVVGETAVYLLGASNELGRRHRAAYLLQWGAMTAARESGCRWYDLGGIDRIRNPDGYHFKRGTGGLEISPAGPFEIRHAGVASRLTLASETVYLAARRLQTSRR